VTDTRHRFSAVLASSSPNKLEELQLALPEWDISALDLLDYPPETGALDYPPETGALDYPPETGATYAANAAEKARFGRRHAPADAWVIAEDSGLEADALGGRPGLESARWAEDGVGQMLAELGDAADRRARYVCAMVAIDPRGAEVAVEGRLEGAIVTGPPRGDEGFGYDPIFVPAGETRTVAELGNGWKRRHSHRTRAAKALAAALARR
jgi:XTP/dITP diphosphohydrolase